MALRGKAKRAIQDGVDNHREFTVGNVKGRILDRTQLTTGQLEWPLVEALRTDMDRVSGQAYVVFSYDTPIAWNYDVDGVTEEFTWVVPDVKYSVTTTNHQNVVRVAIDNPNFYADARW